MIEKIQHATASSPEGAKGLVKGILACAFQNMAFMLPTGLLYLLVKDLLAGSTSGRTAFYLLGCLGCFALIFLTTWFQYNGTYFTTYKESGTRRLTLAERLRKLPLSFFGKRDLADLTSTIMADCEVLEKDCSHFIPGLFGSLISTVLIALSLFTFDGRMALAALWVITVSVAIVVGSYRVQGKVQARTMAAKMACADGIQEYIETLRDLKAGNAEQRYLSGLSGKIRAVEKQSIAAELETALFVSSASMVLKLGIASVALTGSVLLVQGSIDVLTLFLFLMAASRMYDPMQGALQNLAAVIAMRTNVTSNVVNMIGNYLLIQGNLGFPRLGITGAALATVFGTVIACLMSILSVMKRDNFVSIPFIIKEKVRVTLEPAKNMFKVASSVFVEQIFMRIGFLTVSIMVAKLGTDAFAAHQVGMNVMSLSFSFGDGMQVAAVALCGRSLGEKRPDLAQMYGTICQRIGNMISIVLAVLYTTLGTWYFHLFFDEPHLVAMGVEITRVLTFIVLLQIAQVIYMGCLRGAGDVVFTTIASTISITFVRPILSYVFCYACGLGLVGIWLGILGDQTSRLLLTTWRFKSGRWMKIEI